MMGGLLIGQKREAAARFSFLLSIPAITAAGLLQLREAVVLLAPEDFLPLLAGTVVAGVVGYLSIWFLLSFLRKNSTAIFIGYRLILGVIIIVLLWRGVISPQI
jgi:undecaprenyl-diphosphatase